MGFGAPLEGEKYTMCGRFTLATPEQDLVVQFNLPEIPDLRPRYNIAPTQPVAAVRVPADGDHRELVMLHWGLIPFWAKDSGLGARLINARSETVAEKPAFRTAFRRRRCLVPADGFYEWQKENGTKRPFFVHLQDGRAFAFAGLWERWQDKDGSVIESCTLLTTKPNEVIQPLHNRMPVIIGPRDYALWLDPETQDVDPLRPLLRPYPPAEMQAYPVSRYVNSPRNEGPDCILPLGEKTG
jgi:putative SOS response-associated peptidase YedK